MSLESRINRLNQLISRKSSKQADPQLEAKITALQEEFRGMTDEELRRIASNETSGKFRNLTDRELWEITLGSYGGS